MIAQELRFLSLHYQCMCVVYTPVLCIHRGQGRMVGVLLCHTLPYSFETVSLHWPEAKLMAARPSDPPVSNSPSALKFQTCAWPCWVFHMVSGTLTQVLVLCSKYSYPVNISPASSFFCVWGSIIHFWTSENSEVSTYCYSLNVLVKISPLLNHSSVIVIWWGQSLTCLGTFTGSCPWKQMLESLSHEDIFS